MKTTLSIPIEWVRVAPNKVIVATANEVKLHLLQGDNDQFAQPMTGMGDIDTTRKLLDGAMAAAKIAISAQDQPPKLTPNRLVWQLAGAYQITHATPSRMEKARQHFASTSRHSLSNWAEEKVQEETGHDRLALLDICSLGYRGEELVQNIIPSAAMSLVDYLTCSVNDFDPIDCVGYAHALERLALGAKQEHIQKVEDLLAPGINATRYLRLHSNVGADVEHVEKNLEMIAGLMANERIRIVRACYETALILFSPPPEGYLSETKLENMLKPFKLEVHI